MGILRLLSLLLLVACALAQHRHSDTHADLRLLESSPITSPVAAAGYGYGHHPRNTCSCADPQPLPLELSSAARQAQAEAPPQQPPATMQSKYKDSEGCHHLPTSSPGGECGASIAICPEGFCCSQTGNCTKSPEGCDGTCQCKYSGVGSQCKGSVPFALPRHLPVAKPGDLCGLYVATCPSGQCCSQFGFCVADNSVYCSMPSCIPAASLMSKMCVAAEASTSSIAVGSPSKPASTQNPVSPNYSYTRGTVRRFTWVFTWKNLTLDGYEKPVIVVNGEPFPTLEVNVDDRVIVKVINLLGEPLSVHWHGMLQRRTNIMDGVVPVTQAPVQPGETYIYNFIADTAGTYWWHSHYSTQYVDGLWGALVIYDPTHKVYPSDSVVTITEWYHDLANNLTDWYLSPASGGNEPVPQTALFNGNGQGYCGNAGQPDCVYSKIKGVASNCLNPLTKIRVINAGAFAVFNFSIDGHRMIIVAEDGVAIEPVTVGSFQINNGQRYTVLVCQDGAVSTEPVWMRAVMIDANFAYPAPYNTTLGVLYFNPADADTLPTSNSTFIAPALRSDVPANGVDVINPYVLRVLEGIRPPGPPTMKLEYVIYFYNEPEWDPNATQWAHFSRVSLNMEPESPNLIERYTNNPANLGPPKGVPNPPGGRGWHVVDIPLGSIVELVINNNDTGEHPIHLHGHWFWVMDAGLPYAGNYDPNNSTSRLFGRLARDTVTVNTKSYIVLRYLAVNPGMWIMHCHIDWHLAGGLGLIFREGFPPNDNGEEEPNNHYQQPPPNSAYPPHEEHKYDGAPPSYSHHHGGHHKHRHHKHHGHGEEDV